MKTTQPSDKTVHKQEPGPYKVLHDFLERYEARECHAELWRLLTAALSSDDADSWDRLDRGNVVFFCKNIDDLLKALFELREDIKKNANLP
ncbi:MAG TPA: hypothetical protein VD993_06015 [Chitinophagaceae bacterium]|nr:hypothetical protein [Chitinophagaceae bacterium]